MPFRVPFVEPMVNVSTTGAAAAMLMVALPFAAWGDMLSVLPSAQMTFRVPDAGTGLSCTSPVTRLRLNSRVVGVRSEHPDGVLVQDGRLPSTDPAEHHVGSAHCDLGIDAQCDPPGRRRPDAEPDRIAHNSPGQRV